MVPGVGRQIIPSDGGDLLHPRYLPLPGRGVAAEGVKHPHCVKNGREETGGRIKDAQFA